MSKRTPMMEQYYSIKEKYPDCILFFRLGDFYEMFGDDAQLAAPILDLTLTGRDAGKEQRIPMCGIPYHAADGYVAKLVEHGHKVAICEQLEDPKAAKGVVKRDVIRVVTPGTATDEKSLDARGNRYLLGVCGSAQMLGLAACDLSTGEFICTQLESGAQDMLGDEISRLDPPEILVAPELAAWGLDEQIRSLAPEALVHVYEADAFSEAAAERLLEHLQAASFAGYGLDDHPLAVRAAGAVFRYLEETQKVSLRHITGLSAYSPTEQMILDPATRRNLELTKSLRDGGRKGSLLGVLDRCNTALGARLLRKWIEQPQTNPDVINHRLDAVEAFVKDGLLRENVRELLKRIADIERLVGKVATGAAGGRDLGSLRQSLSEIPHLIELLRGSRHPLLTELAEEIDPLDDVAGWLTEALVDDPPIAVTEGGLIRPGFNSEVDQLRDAQANGKAWIVALEAEERERTGIKSLKVGFNRVFGYYIEVTRPNLDLVPESYVRKQTLAGAERFITAELKEKEDLILGAEERLARLEYELFCSLRERVAEQTLRLKHVAAQIAQIDVWASFAHIAVERRYVRPVVDREDRIDIVSGRHPVVEVGREDSFVPNDARLDGDQRLVILTGPNMAGKSTYLRQVALIVLMAQIGSYVPAAHAHVGVVDRIFTRVGASDDLATGQSTFMVEMTETGTICNNATSRSLVLIDELGRGTSTYDGMALAQAIAEYLHDEIRCKTIMSTHYHELTRLEGSLAHCKNLRVDVTEERGRVIFLYKVVPGGADRSYGVNVARMAGLPRPILVRAGRLLSQLERAQNETEQGQLSFIDWFLTEQESAVGSEMSEEEQRILDELRALRTEHLTPIQALQMLDAWQRRLNEG